MTQQGNMISEDKLWNRILPLSIIIIIIIKPQKSLFRRPDTGFSPFEFVNLFLKFVFSFFISSGHVLFS